MVAFIIIYCLVLFAYFFTETSGNIKLRAPNKILLASMFLGYGIYMFVKGYDVSSYHTLLIVAIFLSWLGDVFLLFDFGRGGDFFLCGNVCFVAYQLCALKNNGVTVGQFWWVFVVVAVIVGAYVFCNVKMPAFDIGNLKWSLAMYFASVACSGVLGVALTIFLSGTPLALLGVGTTLFFISDCFLITHKFVLKGNKWILRANSGTYFVGLLLIVLSMGL